IWANVQRRLGVPDVDAGRCEALVGLDGIGAVVLVDQQPIGRSRRSNPVTFVKAYDALRKLFAGSPDALARGIGGSDFSFNVAGGRCPACEGTGVQEVDMQFMAPVVVSCAACDGHRFRPEVLAVRCRGSNIAETLALTVDQARARFADQKALAKRLDALVRAGLGYLRLGQPTSTLSGGEAQRLKLASFLDPAAAEGRRLFLFDEPTTGLHVSDIEALCRTLRELVRRGDGVVVVEHSLDLVALADWIVELGPGGGEHGGQLLYSGPIEGFLAVDSPTAEELRRFLG
ncbi:MAG: excinuclease ABC subunit A, partial [Chloroflexi bacterium]|nr:excinuclease ABC subunit A [Chloroflexota bacterium]